MDVFCAIRATEESGVLSEGPYWDARARALHWVDIQSGLVHSGRVLDSGRITLDRTESFSNTVGAVVVSTSGELVVAEAHGVTVMDGNGRRRPFSRVLDPASGRRINDMSVDPRGRLFLGTLALDQPSESETLVRIEGDGAVTVVDDDLTLSNGIAWSPDGRRMYSVDSLRRIVVVREYDPATGATGPREVFVGDVDGIPDGLCTDSEGGVWVAVWGAAQVRRYRSDGRQDAVIEVPAPHVSSACFVGDDLRTLVITTARHDLTDADLDRFPASGALFSVRLSIPGTPVATWRGPTPKEGAS
ncbi:sugar lactone lactonase YvrE [Microbacterium sp. ZKA21]|uniref:SMP-30/gluconolactonase/LRE family protein n=1 Tax=Microbacterium sp. ZKA21 TaxID=3381694 RepID=UPI003D2340F4